MSRRPVTVRVFLLVAVLALIVLPVASGSAAWLVEQHRQEAHIQHRLNAATAYLAAHREGVVEEEKSVMFGVSRRLSELHLLAQFGVVEKKPFDAKAVVKQTIYASPGLKSDRLVPRAGGLTEKLTNVGAPKSWRSYDLTIRIGEARPSTAIIGTLYYRPPDLTTRALVALAAGVLVLLSGLAISVWLVGRWIVNPLSRLSSQVDKIAGGELAVAVPPSRISEVANVAAAIDGMATALGETGQQQAAADEARRFLITAVAHDLRTPLFALRGHLEAITSDLGDPDEHLAKAQERAAALERLISSLFTFARHDYAPQEPLLEIALIGDLVRAVAAGLRGDFCFTGDDNLAVVVDRERFERVLVNVFDNALRHGARKPVDVAWFERGSTVELTVGDRGPGIEADLLPNVFQPMVRGDRSRNGSTGGAGLGLTIAERLIESQGGTIAADNRQGGGAVFTLTLRRANVGSMRVTAPYPA
jgi:signal transduction histidine kinase